MPTEIERKFLTTGNGFVDAATQTSRIAQGFLSTDPKRTVRVRLMDDTGYLTIKGISTDDGTTRDEWEYTIDGAEASELLKLCLPSVIEKTRYVVKAGNGRNFEVDVFHGDNEGLVLAEIELASVDEHFDKPVWLGEEVTGDKRYYNSNLSRNPYSIW